MTRDEQIHKICLQVTGKYHSAIRRLAVGLVRDTYRAFRRSRIPTYKKSGKGCQNTEAWIIAQILLNELIGLDYEITFAEVELRRKGGGLRSMEFKKVVRG